MDFIDRERETRRLRRALDGSAKEFIVVYGRRRMGKSALIKRVLRPGDVYFEADTNESAVQIDLLVRCIAAVYPALEGATFRDWDTVLSSFNRVCEENSTLVLDEFPYLVKQTPALPSIIQRLIDAGNLRYNLIICGSSQRMMQNMILDAGEPLYGRASEKINLGPIGVRYWKDYFKMSSIEAIEEYSVWGGVPRYWVLRERYDSLFDALEYLTLDPNGMLFNEPASLFMDEFSDIAPYASIMTAMGDGVNKFSRLAEAVGRKTGEITKPLSQLCSMHYLRKEVPFGESERNSRRTLYQFQDCFIAYYYKFIASNKSMLSLGRIDSVLANVKAHLPELTSRVWERLCNEAVSGNQLFESEWGMAGRWWGNVPLYEDGKKSPVGYDEIEIDLIAESSDRKKLLIGECKWAKEDFADRLFRVLETKVRKMQKAGIPFLKNREIVFALFLKNPPISTYPTDSTHQILTPDDLFTLL